MDQDVSVLQMVFKIDNCKSRTCRNLGECPAGVEVDSVTGITDNNQLISDKKIHIYVVDGDMVVYAILPRKESATMRVTIWVRFKTK